VKREIEASIGHCRLSTSEKRELNSIILPVLSSSRRIRQPRASITIIVGRRTKGGERNENEWTIGKKRSERRSYPTVLRSIGYNSHIIIPMISVESENEKEKRRDADAQDIKRTRPGRVPLKRDLSSFLLSHQKRGEVKNEKREAKEGKKGKRKERFSKQNYRTFRTST